MRINGYYQNRELSWLKFNERVIDEADDSRVPLCERLTFVSIFNSNLDEFYDSHHPAVLEMIRMVVENAHKEGIWAGICGELGADTTLTKEFLSMGVDELSVSAGKLLAIRKIIRETDTSKIKAGE